MRIISDHMVNMLNTKLNVVAHGRPTNVGAYTHYRISGFDTVSNPEVPKTDTLAAFPTVIDLFFQNGNPNNPAVGANGVTHEVLLAIVADRLRGFQSGPLAHDCNSKALAHIEAALSYLAARTTERVELGIEGQRV